VRIVIGEDQALLRHSLVRLLEDAGFEVAGQAADAPDVLRR
jgi:DNA-binding NarL/FixJ family response regulator